MENKRMMYDVNQAKIYRDAYRPSSNLSRFFKAVMSIMLVGDSPLNSKHPYYSVNKRLK